MTSGCTGLFSPIGPRGSVILVLPPRDSRHKVRCEQVATRKIFVKALESLCSNALLWTESSNNDDQRDLKEGARNWCKNGYLLISA